MTITAPARTANTVCADCAVGGHGVCRSEDCTCTTAIHAQRPGFGRAGAEPEGLCGYCRPSGGPSHKRCTSAACRCTAGAHPNRSTGSPLDDVRARASAGGPGVRAPEPKAAKLVEPVWELVKADPPAPPPKPHKLTVVERARPFVEQIMAEDDRDWHRFAIFPSSIAAGQVRARVAKAYPELEFRSVRVPEIGQSALYGRWTGNQRKGQL